MRWKANWWGIIIIAQSGQDNDLLEDLYKRLPKEIKRVSRDYYEDGILEKEIEEGVEYISLVFHR